MTEPTRTASTRRLTFVPTAAEARPARDSDVTVVLDTAWTPEHSGRADVRSLRPYFGEVVEGHDLPGEALVALDRWAAGAELPERLTVEGVTYWYRVREPLWHWVHERLLWRYALTAIQADIAPGSVAAPANEEALVDVLRASGLPVTVEADGADSDPTPPGGPRRSAGDPRRAIGRLARRLGVAPPAPAARHAQELQAMLDERVQKLLRVEGPRVVVLTLPGSFQRVGRADAGERLDPNLGAVIKRLQEEGLEPIVIGLGMRRNRTEDWATVVHDDRLLPAWMLPSRWGRDEDDRRAASAVAALAAGLAAASRTRFVIGGSDMTAGLAAALEETLRKVVDPDVHQLARVERLLVELKPAVLLLTQEGHRIPWLLAAARAGVPTFALQHGILYPTHPGYADRRHPRLIVPTRTFVFGEFERRVLEGGAYHAGEVAVSGSPRLDLERAAAVGADAFAEREAVRAELGVGDGDAMLVVSTLHAPFVRRSHLVHMLEVCLGGPLPGVHLVFKQHPGELDDGPYRELLTGLARAGGYEPPPMTLVKDIDLYRLLGAADAHLGQHSTVLTDAVVTGTPNLIAIVEPSQDILGYVAAGVARPVRSIDDVRTALRDPRSADPAARRSFLDDHFRDGDASARIARSIADAIERPADIDASTGAVTSASDAR